MLVKTWNRLYKEPATYAPDFTRWSRNFLNLGIGALVVSWFFLTGPNVVRFAFADITDADIQRLDRVEGEWLYIGGRNSMHTGIVAPGTKQYLAHMQIFVPARTGPHTQHRPASAHIYPGVGIVQMEIDGISVLTVSETQEHFRQRTYRFISLVAFSTVMFVLSVSRQLLLAMERKGG